MATKKPRITISLNPHLYATIQRLSELGGQPMATIVSEMLDSVHEPLMRTVAFLEAASEAPKQIQDGLRRSFESVERELYGSAGHSLKQMDFILENLQAGGAPSSRERKVAIVRSRSGSPGAGGTFDPPIVIRGSGSTQSSAKKSRRP